jgi:hypothetical protein
MGLSSLLRHLAAPQASSPGPRGWLLLAAKAVADMPNSHDARLQCPDSSEVHDQHFRRSLQMSRGF